MKPGPFLFHKLGWLNVTDDFAAEMFGSHVAEALRIESWKSDSQLYQESKGAELNSLRGVLYEWVWNLLVRVHQLWLNGCGIVVTIFLIVQVAKAWTTAPIDVIRNLISITGSDCRYVGLLLRRFISCILQLDRTSDALAEPTYHSIHLRRTTHTEHAIADRDSFIRSSLRRFAPRFLTDNLPEFSEAIGSLETLRSPGVSLPSEDHHSVATNQCKPAQKNEREKN